MMITPAPAPSSACCLFLDVDGTLIELSDTPFDAHGDAPLIALLRGVSTKLGGALALVSGRSIEYLDALFAPLRLPCAGLHGVERRAASGALEVPGLGAEPLDHARTALAAAVRAHAGTLLEDKGGTVAVHYRLAPQFEAVMRDAVAAAAAVLGSDYQVLSGNMMFEIKPRGFNKGSAVSAFLEEPPFAGRTPVYVGDDRTDLDGFRAVHAAHGISIAVGDRIVGQYRLADPAAVRAWLAQIEG